MSIKVTKWMDVARRAKSMAGLITDATAEGIRRKFLKEFYGGPQPKAYRHFDSARWFDEEGVENATNFLKKQENLHPGYLIKLAKRAIRHYQKFGKWVKTNAKNGYSNFSDQKLAEEFWKFYSRTFFVPLGYLYIFTNKFLPDEIIPEVARKEPNLERQTEYFSSLFGLDVLTEIKEEKINLYKIAALYPKAELEICNHWKKYKYLKRYYYLKSDYTLREIQARVKAAAKKVRQGEEVELPSSIARKTKDIIKMLGLSKTAIFKIYGAKAMGEASNRFDEIFAWSISKIDPLLLEIAKRLKVTRAELANARGEEIVSALEKGPAESYRAELKQRIINYSLVLENGKISVHSGKSYQEYLKKESRSEKVNTKIRELHGQGVSAGKAKGRVKIVWDASEMKKVKRGDILVATSTYPALVPAMEKAGAIVTNEGGLLSHAAIVSRELGIPCVVGTKIGTKVLKDGDLVEVDANKGIVKRI